MEPLIPKHGGYRKLKSFQVAQLRYDVTLRFCEPYIDRRSRTRDQMIQAARSGVQNIAEGSEASATSKKTEMRLTQVARASLEELRLDYEDFLRQRRLPLWPQSDPRRHALVARRCRTAEEVAAWIQETPAQSPRPSMPSVRSIPSIKRPTYAELASNSALVLIGVVCALLERQVQSQGRAFLEEGGFSEKLYRLRSQRRSS